ncbi:MAG: transglutaminase domain-containing protein [Candidatus Aenigmarchaeota archaeon]|nr:transglutaminase domain-containing protein [Candidatus Aenigmarchaeota archaeon]
MKHTTFFLTGIMLFLVGVSGYAFGAFHFAYGGSAENSITANLIYPYGNHDYVDFWHENKNQIARIFNPFIEQFNNSGCIDHIYLRALIKQNGEIHKKSFELVGPGADDIDAAYALHSFVVNEISYVPVDVEFDAVETLINKKGDCSEKSVLLLSLLKARGIDAYVVEGNAHRYVFAKLDGVWVPIDATAKDFYFVYNAWDDEKLRSPYVSDIQSFIFDENIVLFNKDWCLST